ncbi:MAG: terminase TerL endonuclease subunit, partial [Aurantimonas coralicida]
DPAIFTTPSGEAIGGGERAVRFIRALRHPKTGKPFQLDPWQERLVRRIYGPRDADGHRIVDEVVMMVPRGARKTTLGAALALLHSVGPERVPHGQVILAAYDREQARIAYDEASGMVAARKQIADATRVRDFVHEIEHRKSGATLKAVSSDAAAQNGKTPAFVLVDEIHAWRKRALYDVLRTGLTKTANTLSIVISQAGRGTDNLADEVFGYARKVASGEIDQPSMLPVLFETAPEADWRDEAVWHRANPGLAHGYPNLKKLRKFAKEAETRPALREKFRNDHLNVWLSGQAAPWLEIETWDKGGDPLDLSDREGEPAWIGVDLGSTSDLTTIVMALRDDDGGYTVAPFVFAPEASLRRRTERGEAPYQQWADEGHLIATPGEITDQQLVEEKLRELCERFTVQEIAFDPWSARTMMTRLLDDGLPAVEHRQGFRSFAEPMSTFEGAVLTKKLRHGGHPVLRWCIGNLVVDSDPAGNLKPTKSKAREKIDAAVAAIMAVGRAAANEVTRSVYQSDAWSNELAYF